MQQFLKQIAEIFYKNERKHISNYAFVFPNKRAGLFFKKYLYEVADQPLFVPRIFSINDFFVQYTDLKIEARIPLLFRLYNVFMQQLENVDSFELFMPFGEMLLSDFDDIEKYNVEAKQLFSNIQDLKEIDNKFGGLTPEQIDIIRRFWEKLLPIDEHKTFNKNFVEMWQYIYPIYCSFTASLKNDGFGYEGLVFEDALQQLYDDKKNIAFDKVVFAGFNALNEQERRLFDVFKQKGIADFYWDQHSSFFNGMTNAEIFINENAKKYPSHYSLQSKEQQKELFDIIAVPSGIGQTKQVHDILKHLKQNDENTVIVLPDERLLLPMLCSIPEEVEKLNITMGYSLSLSAVHALVHSLFEMQMAARVRKDNVCTFYYKHVLSILNNSSLQCCSEKVSTLVAKINAGRCFWLEKNFFAEDDFLAMIFEKSTEKDLVSYIIQILKCLYIKQSGVEKEILSSYIMLLNQLNSNIEKSNLSLSIEAIASLVDRAVGFSSVPFNGEPLEGVQLMGFLETRSLDFENVIITSMNEGVCPKKLNSTSIVPYSLRKAFGLPTFEQQDAIAAYHFYRLLTGAKRIFLLYDDRIDDMKKGGEVSRYIYQLKYLYDVKKLKLEEKSLTFDVNFVKTDNGGLEIKKDETIMQKIECFADANSKEYLSASALNNYIQCPLKFYLSKIVGIKEPDEITENIEANVFGSIFHKAMELIYEEYKGKEIIKDTFVRLKASIDDAVKVAFSKEYLKIKDESKYEEPKGRNELVTHVIKKYIQTTLDYDEKNVPFTYVESEKKAICKFPIFNGGKTVLLSGFIDRIHKKDDIYFVVDYKTGSDELSYKNIKQLFDKEDVNRPKAVFQTLMYAMMLKKGDSCYNNVSVLQPNVFQIKKIINADYSPQIYQKKGEKLDDYNKIADEYEDEFRTLLEEIFDPNIPFRQCSSIKNCEYCPFKTICDR